MLSVSIRRIKIHSCHLSCRRYLLLLRRRRPRLFVRLKQMRRRLLLRPLSRNPQIPLIRRQIANLSDEECGRQHMTRGEEDFPSCSAAGVVAGSAFTVRCTACHEYYHALPVLRADVCACTRPGGFCGGGAEGGGGLLGVGEFHAEVGWFFGVWEDGVVDGVIRVGFEKILEDGLVAGV